MHDAAYRIGAEHRKDRGSEGVPAFPMCVFSEGDGCLREIQLPPGGVLALEH